MSRSWLIGASVVVHAAVGIGLFASGVWRIQRVEARANPTFLSVAPPPPPPASGQLAGAVKPPDTPKVVRKKRPDALVQLEDKKPQEETPTTTIGSEAIPGPPDGPPSDSPCLESCGPTATARVEPVCGNRTTEVGEQCDDGNLADGDGCSRTCRTEPRRPTTVAMNVLAGLRTWGDTQIQPSSSTQSQMVRDGVDEVHGRITVCISTTGDVTASLSGTTQYPDYDRTLLSAVQTWRYRPYSVNGVAVPACSLVQFHYRMR